MTGQPKVFSEQCPTCVFRPGNLMKLRPGRLKDIIDRNVAVGGALVCHETLPLGDHPELGEIYCRGFYDSVGERTNLIRVMNRLGGFAEIDPPPAKEQSA